MPEQLSLFYSFLIKQKLHITLILVVSTFVIVTLTFAISKDSSKPDPDCPQDVMMCPDGSSVPRKGEACEFLVCGGAAETQSSAVSKEDIAAPSPFAPLTAQEDKNAVPLSPRVEDAPKKESTFTSLVTAVTETVGSLLGTASQALGIGSTDAQTPTASTQNQTPSFASNTSLNDNRYQVSNGTIVNTNGVPVATLPQSLTETASSGWQTTIVNAIDVGSTTPVVGGIPVAGAAGKYYISSHSFGNRELCEFSNRIYIVDTVASTETLLYEENNQTLSIDDPRACNSEFYLLATEDEKLIMKYHTLETNMICESTWSEPDKTWFLDVTTLSNGIRRYAISIERYSAAEADEVACRASLP